MSEVSATREYPSNEKSRDALMAILKFIQKHPQAKHTAEGIASNWILQQRLEEQIEIVLDVIRYLVEKGFLDEIHKADDENYYRVNKKKLSEISFEIERINHPPAGEK